MINDKNLKEMMNIYVKDGVIETKVLNNLGFLSSDLTKLVHEENSILERLKKGSYKVYDKELFKYALKLINEGDLETAYNVLYRCHLNDKDNITYIYNLFMVSILLDKYSESVECLEVLLNDTSKIYKDCDINYYFLLLGLAKKLPKELIERFKCIKFEDIQVLTGDKDNDIPFNTIRGKVIKSNFRNIEIVEDKNSLEYKVQSKLIDIINKLQYDERDYMYDLIKSKDLQVVLDYINKDLSYRNLTSTENYFVYIIKSYFDMERTKKIPVLKSMDCSDVWDAIDNNNFRSALRLQREFCEKTGFETYRSQLYLLLEQVNEMIDAVLLLSEEKGKVKKTSVEVSKNNEIVNIPLSKPNLPKEEVTLEGIIDSLVSNDIDKASSMISEYLIGTGDYSYLVNYLIKISIYEKDSTFSKPMMAISMMKFGSFNFNVSEYILSFYEALGKKKFEIAGVYLDILDKAEEKGHAKIAIKGMRDVLNNATFESKDKFKRPSYDFVSVEEKKKATFEDLNFGYSLDEFKAREILLVDIEKVDFNYIMPIIEELSYVDAFVIGEENRKLVLRYRDNQANSQLTISSLIKTGYEKFALEDYASCLKVYKTLLSKTYVPNSNLYYRLGEVCFKLDMKDLALDYFIVSREVNKVEQININYYDIIDKLIIEPKKVESNEDIKRREEVVKYYGFDIDRVTSLVFDKKMSLKDAISNLGLSEEDYLRCALYIAREYYYLGDARKGNVYLNLVTTRTSLSREISELYRQVNVNKKFYKNDELGGPRLRLK